jgi:hypothetical protein
MEISVVVNVYLCYSLKGHLKLRSIHGGVFNRICLSIQKTVPLKKTCTSRPSTAFVRNIIRADKYTEMLLTWALESRHLYM